jgi:copper ion binding protein
MATLSFQVPGMTCGHCKASVENEITKLAGVTAVRVNLESKDVEIDAADVTWEQISSAIDEAGFEAVAK